jgi:hypothetical protein
MVVFLKLIYRFNAIPIKISGSVQKSTKKILKFPWKSKGSIQHSKTILKKNNKIGTVILPDFKMYFKATVIKTVWCWP